MWTYSTAALAALALSTTAQTAALPANNPIDTRAEATYSPWSQNAAIGIATLNKRWYDSKTGLWQNAWWNSANMLTILADYAILNPSKANSLHIQSTIDNTYHNAQKTYVQSVKTINKFGMVDSHYCLSGAECESKSPAFSVQGFNNFINYYYDDEGWWALALIRAYQATGKKDYIHSAITIFNDMEKGGPTNCGGGIYWNKDRSYANAIANELYLAVAAELAAYIPSNPHYLNVAKKQWSWFFGSHMVNSHHLVNDGLKNCKNNGLQTWTYNQGVVLGAAARLYKITGNKYYVDKAKRIANAAIQKLSDKNYVLHETDNCELKSGHCGADGQQFKGVFMRNLRYLWEVTHDQHFKNFILINANSIWHHDRIHSSSYSSLGVSWPGPYIGTTAMAHSSALDAVVAAAAVTR